MEIGLKNMETDLKYSGTDLEKNGNGPKNMRNTISKCGIKQKKANRPKIYANEQKFTVKWTEINNESE